MISFSRSHCARIALAFSSSSAISRFSAVTPELRHRIPLVLERLLLDLQLHQPTLHLVDLGRHAVDLHLDLRGSLVDEIDRLVRQEPLGHVAVREDGRGHERRVLDADPVVDLVALLQAAQDGDRVLDRGLAHEHRLEPPLERRVLLDALPVLVERGRADAAQLPARQGRLQQVRRVHRALGRAGAHERVDLVDEQDDLPRAGLDLLQHGLEPLLELAAELRPRHERAEVERDEPLVLERLGDVAAHDALRDPLDDGRLADARLSDEHGVVLRPAREHLHHAADLLVAADDRVALALARHLGEVAAVLLERLKLPLRVLVGHALAAAHRRERAQELVVRDPPGALEEPLDLAVVPRHREDVVLHRRELVLERLCLVVRLAHDLVRPPREAGLGPAADAREPFELAGERGLQRHDVRPRLLEQRSRDAPLLQQHGGEQVLGDELGVAPARSLVDGLAERLLALGGHLVGTHGSPMASRERSDARGPGAARLYAHNPGKLLNSWCKQKVRPLIRHASGIHARKPGGDG